MSKKGEGKRQSNFFDVCCKCKTNYDCCHDTRPPITENRRRIIEEYLKKERIPIVDAFVEEEYVFPRENEEGYCVFHDMKKRKCKIHAVKPETCVAGPMTFDINRKTGKIEWFVKMSQLCSLAGIVYDNKDLLRQHLESAKKEVSRLVQELSSEALIAVLKKDEPETFKISEDSIAKSVLDKLVH